MVLQHVHSQHARSFSHGSEVRLDPARIAAGAGALALNIVVLLLLLVPAAMPESAPQSMPRTEIVPIVRETPPVPPAPPEQVEIVDPQPAVTPVAVTPEIAAPVVERIVIDQGLLPAETVVAQPANTGPADIAPPSQPVAGVRLEYAKAPSPPYPRDAVRAGLQGTVLLRVLVNVDGRPLQVDIEQGSGHRSLDDAARRFVQRNWTFRPAVRNGQPVQAIGIVPIEFSLD